MIDETVYDCKARTVEVVHFAHVNRHVDCSNHHLVGLPSHVSGRPIGNATHDGGRVIAASSGPGDHSRSSGRA